MLLLKQDLNDLLRLDDTKGIYKQSIKRERRTLRSYMTRELAA